MTDWDVLVQFTLHCDLSISFSIPIILSSTVFVLVTVTAAGSPPAGEDDGVGSFVSFAARMTEWDVFVRTRVIARDGGPIVFKGGGAGWMRALQTRYQVKNSRFLFLLISVFRYSIGRAPFLLLQLPHSNCKFSRKSPPPFLRGTTWSM